MPATARLRLPAAATAAAALTLVATACGSSQTTTGHATGPATGGRPARIARCTGAQLRPAYVNSDGATGHMELTIALHNTSPRPCRVAGYPAARLLGTRGAALSFRVADGHGFFPDTLPRPRPMLVAPGHSVHYGISFVTNNEYAGAHVCHQLTAALAALPGSARRWHRVSLRHAPRLTACGDRLVVSPIHA